MAGRQIKARYRRDNRMRNSLLLAATVVALVSGVVLVRVYGVSGQLREKQEYIAELRAQIAQEQERTKEIEEFQKYTQTRGYVEKIAKEKLGLVYDGEIVFRHE